MRTISLNVSSLQLDLDNSRFPEPPDSQRDAIMKMVDLQGDKLVSLARDIIEHGLDPSERLIVLEDEDGSLIVVEGNRRVTTLKLLNQPDIVNESIVTKKIKNLLKTKPEIPKEIDCVVFDNDEEFAHWVSLKHTGANAGAGRVQWTGQETDRHRAKHGNTSFGNQLLSFISLEKDIPSRIIRNTKKLKITNLNRLLGDPQVRKSLGLEPPIEGVLYCYEHKNEFIEKMLLVLDCMLECDDKGRVVFTVDRIKKKPDRTDFITQLGISESELKLSRSWKVSDPNSFIDPNEKKTPKANQQEGAPVEHSESYNADVSTNESESEHKGTGKSSDENVGSSQHKAVKPNPNRNNLVPANVQIKISDKKCAGVFRELKNTLRHDDHANSLAIMLRIFIELSVGYYIEHHAIQLESNKTGLHDKVVKVTNHLVARQKITNKQCTAVQAASTNTLKSNGALQQYVHNNHMFPDRNSVNTTWDNFESLLCCIWS